MKIEDFSFMKYKAVYKDDKGKHFVVDPDGPIINSWYFVKEFPTYMEAAKYAFEKNKGVKDDRISLCI